jgi:hypothetical protein
MRTIGLEIEMSDVKLIDAVKTVYALDGRPLELWEDRYGAKSKPRVNYSRWNVMSDGHIHNSDGSRCMYSYRDEETGKLVQTGSSKSTIGRRHWKGAELVTPALESFEEGRETLSALLSELKNLGAAGLPGTYIHVHVNVSDLPFEQIRDWTPSWMDIQDSLNRLRWHGPPPVKNIPMYTQKLVDDLLATNSPDEFRRVYQTGPDGKLKTGGHFKVRRIVDPTPRFDTSKSYNTIEFRLARTVLDINYINEVADLALGIVCELEKYGRVNPVKVDQAVESIEQRYFNE